MRGSTPLFDYLTITDSLSSLIKQKGSMIFGKDKMISYLYRFLLLAIPLI